MPITTTSKAIVRDDTSATCWVDAELAEKLRSPDARASINDLEASSVTVELRPMSDGEVRDSPGSGYLADGLTLEEWNYQVDLVFPESPYGSNMKYPFLAPVDVVTAVEHPITLVFGT